MLEVSQQYKQMAESDTREVSVKVVMGNTVLTNDDIIELNIYRSIGESGFSIGGVASARVRLLAVMKLPYSGEVAMDVFVRFGFDEKGASDYVQLGHFYGHASNPSNKTAQVEIIGYDKLGSSGFNSRCTFAKAGGAELTFPCTVQEMLQYVCKRRNIESEFQCFDYTVSEMPVKDKSKDSADYERYYTYKEIIGFIAAAHGASAAIDSEGKLVFLSAKESEEQVNKSDCIDFAITSAEKFTVKGILLHVQNVLSTGSTNIFINDDSKTAYDGEISEGVVETSCPFGSIEIAEALWGQLGGFSYNSCEFTRRGRGWTELGDIVKAVDDLGAKISGEYVNRDMVVQTVELSFSADGGFMEHIISKAENSEESAERLGSANAINNVSGGVGKFTNEAKNSEIFNSYEDVTNDSGTVTAKKNYINPNTAYAHVSGASNAIDEDDSITSFSNMAAIVEGQNNKILNSSSFAFIGGGQGNKIEKAYMSAIIGGSGNGIQNINMACIAGGSGNSVDGHMSFIGGGMNNKIVAAMFSAICGGNGNSISITGMANAFIGGGGGNKITGTSTSDAAILGGGNNTVAATGSGILAGMSNSVDDNAYYSAVVCGTGNHVQGSYSAILCGGGNTVSGGNNAVIAGVSNIVEGSENAVIGEKNKVIGNSQDNFVCGQENEVNGANDCVVCGESANAWEIHKIVVGQREKGNVFYVRYDGAVFATSFNIIGETTSEVSTFSARSSDTPDISELTAQISEIKADIEALRAENAALRAEIAALK